MKFNIGDKVKFIDQQGQGVVTKIINPSTVGVTTDGFELPYLVTDLIKVEKPSSTAERLFYEGKANAFFTKARPPMEALARRLAPGKRPIPARTPSTASRSSMRKP